MIAAQVALLVATDGLNHDTASRLSAVAPLIAWLAVPTALLLVVAPRLARITPTLRALAIVIVVGLVLRLVWLGTLPPLEDDFYRYLWDGYMVARGHSPYALPPQHFIGGTEPWQAVLSGINYPEMRTIYPAVAQAAFALAHVIAPFKVDGLRLVFTVAELVTLWLVIVMLRDLGRSPLWAVLYWWNPFAAYTMVGIAHVDALIPPFVLGGALALTRGRPLLALALFGLGAGVKVWPVMLAPLALWPMLRDPRRLITGCAVFGAVLLAVVGPVALSALRPGSGLSAYAAGWSNNNGFYAWALYGVYGLAGSWETAERIFRPAIALATVGLALCVAARGDLTPRSVYGRALVVAAAVFYLSPAQFPWYAVWFLPLAALLPNRPLLLATATLPFYYLFFPLWPVRNGVWFFYLAAFIHSLPVLGWLAYDWYRGRRTDARTLP